jgi:transcriptional regulator with XRE-family HTH domain
MASVNMEKVDVSQLREFSGLDQTEFWGRVGVTQPGGSRYENGRRIPKPVQELLRLVYIEKLDLGRVRRADVELVEFLRAEEPDTYQKLKERSKVWARKQRR